MNFKHLPIVVLAIVCCYISSHLMDKTLAILGSAAFGLGGLLALHLMVVPARWEPNDTKTQQ